MIYINNGNAATIRIGGVWHTVQHGATVDTTGHHADLGNQWAPVDADPDDLIGLDLDALLHVVELEHVDIGAAATVNGVTRKIRKARQTRAATETEKS